MNKDFLLQIKDKLELEKKELKSKLLEKQIGIDMEGDEIDEIQGKQLAEVNNQLLSRTSNKLNLIDGAISRIDTGVYGTCVDCEDLISDFPINFFLLHPGSNYINQPAAGKDAHRAQVLIENFIADRPVEEINVFYSQLAKLVLGRDLTVFLTKKDKSVDII